jgi:hypothetical protein
MATIARGWQLCCRRGRFSGRGGLVSLAPSNDIEDGLIFAYNITQTNAVRASEIQKLVSPSPVVF